VNSFHTDHQHGSNKLVVRWYCPMCDTLYAVTHRGYHIKNRHKSTETPEKQSTVKIEQDEDEDEDGGEGGSSSSEPKNKRSHEDDDNTSQDSTEDPGNVLVSISRQSSFQPLNPSVPVIPLAPMPAPVPTTTNAQGTGSGSSGGSCMITPNSSQITLPPVRGSTPNADSRIQPTVTSDALGSEGYGLFTSAESFARLGNDGPLPASASTAPLTGSISGSLTAALGDSKQQFLFPGSQGTISKP